MSRGIAVWIGAICSAFATWVALHAHGHDWYATMGQFTIIRHWGWAPFSYHYSGGAGLFQDPQGMMASPSVHVLTRVLATLGAPTEHIARLWTGLYVGWGAIGMTLWLGRRVSAIAGAFAAIAWCTSLAFLWRIAAGHTPFVLYAWAPWVLLATESWLNRPQLRSSLILAALAALTVWEPGFHALFYLIIPCVAITLALQWRKLPSIRYWLLSAGVFAGLTAPRWATWLTLPMSRSQDPNDGVIGLRDALYSLFATARAHNLGMRIYPPVATGAERWQNLWEIATAMAPTASVLALLGAALAWRSPRSRSTAKFAVIMLVLGIAFATQGWLWSILRFFTDSGIRGPGRFLGLASFGLAILAGLGCDAAVSALARKFPIHAQRWTLGVCALVMISVLGFQANWVVRAMKRGTLVPAMSQQGDPIEKPRVLFKTYCSVGSGCLNNFDHGFAESKFDHYLADQNLNYLDLEDERLKEVEISPTQIKVNNLAPQHPRILPFRNALMGQAFESSDPKAVVDISFKNGPLTVLSDRPVDWVKITALPLIPAWSIWVFCATFLMAVAGSFLTTRHRA